MKIVRTVLRWLLYTVLVVVAFAVGALAVLTLTERGRENLAGLISDMASSEGQTVRLRGLSGIWSGHLALDSVMVGDAEGDWLALRGVTVDWSPGALLSGTFRAERIAAQRVEVARAPQAQPASSGGGGGGLPVALDIRAIDLPDIALGEALAGGVASVSAEGSLKAEADPLVIDAVLKAARTDGVPGNADATVRFAPGDNVLDLDLKVAEPAGGILANLLRLPGAPAVDIALAGSGPAADWRGAGTLSLDGAVVARLDGTHRFTERGSAVEATGEGEFQRFVPAMLQPLLAGRTAFDFAGQLNQGGGVVVERGSFASDAVAGTASGALDPEGQSDLRIEVAAKAQEGVLLSFGTEESPIDMVARSATITAEGSGRRPRLDIAAQLASVKTNAAQIAGLDLILHSDGFDIETLTGQVSGSAAAAALTIDNPTAAPLLAGKVSVGFEGALSTDTLTVSSGTMTSDAVSGAFAGGVTLANGAIALNVDLDVDSAALPVQVRPALAARTHVTGSITRDTQGNVSASPFAIESEGLSAEGRVVTTETSLEAEASGRMEDLSRLSDQVAGGGAFTLRATGARAAPDFTLTLTSDSLAAFGREATAIKATATGKADVDNPAAAVAVSATFAGQPIELRGDVSGAEGQRGVSGLQLSVGANRLTGDVALTDALVPAGTLSFDFPDIALLAAMAGEGVTGSMTGTIRLDEQDGRPTITAAATAPAVTRGEIGVADATVEATISDYLTLPTVNGRIRAARLTSGDTVVEDIDVALTRDGEWTRFDGGAAVADILAKAAGRFRIADGVTTVELTAGEATVQGYRTAVAAPSTVRIAGGAVTFDTVTLDVNGATAVLSGTAGEALDVVATLTAGGEGMALSFGTPESPIDLVVRSASVRALGDRTEPNLDVAVSVSSVTTPQASLQSVDLSLHSDAFDLSSRTGPVSGEVAAAAVTLSNASLAPLLTGRLTASLAGTLGADRLDVSQGTIAGDAVAGNFSGGVSLSTGEISLKLDADIASSALPAAARPVLGERLALAGTVGRDAEGRIAASGLTLRSGPLEADGSASLAGDRIEASVTGRLADVSLIASDASGAVDFSVQATGEAGAPDLNLKVDAARIVAAGREITGLTLTAAGRADLDNPTADVTLAGTVAGEALRGSARLSTAEGRREIKGLSLSLGENRVAGDLTLDDAFVPLGSVDFTLPDVGALAALALETVEGDLAGTVRFTREGGKPQLAAEARTARIARGDIAARNVVLDATIADYMAAPTIAGRVQAGEVVSGGTVVSGVDVTLTRDGDWTGFDGGATVADIPARAAGRVRVAGERTEIELRSADATVRGLVARLARPTTVGVAGGAATLDRLTLDLGGGTATVTGTAGATLAIDATLQGVPASLADRFAPGIGAAGAISGTVKATGQAAAPHVNYSLTWRGAETAQTRGAGLAPLDVTSTGDFVGGRLSFQANAGGGGGISLRGGGTVDTNARALALDLSGGVPFAAVSRQVAAQGLGLTGTADVTLQVRGPFSSPAIGGSVRTSGARLVDSRSGLALNDVRADISLGGGRATIRTLTGTLSTQGTVSATGSVGIEAGSGFPADIAVMLRDARYTDGRLVTATMSGDLTLRGSLTAAPTLSGTINLARTVITVPEGLPGSLAALDVQHRNAPAAVRKQDEAIRPPAGSGGGGSGGLVLDITVNAENQIFVKGRGVDAELGGSLRLVGPTDAPSAAGEFTLRRGRLNILARRLDFTSGTITFAGSLVPFLNLTAESDTGDVTVTISVTGPANDPKFAFSSVPALPEDEVLARLIFGRSLSNLSPLQIAQLADAAAQLTGGTGSSSLFEALRSNLGVDDLDIRTDDQGGTSVAVGKYLNDRTYVTLEKGDKAGSGKATINLDIGKGLKLRGQATDAGEAKGGIFFEREY